MLNIMSTLKFLWIRDVGGGGEEQFLTISEAQRLTNLSLFKVSGVEGIVMGRPVYKLRMLGFACTTHSLNIDRRDYTNTADYLQLSYKPLWTKRGLFWDDQEELRKCQSWLLLPRTQIVLNLKGP